MDKISRRARTFSLSWRKRHQDGSNGQSGRQRATSVASEKAAIRHSVADREQFTEKQTEDATAGGRDPSLSVSTMGRNPSLMATANAIADDRIAQRLPKAIPAWVRDADEDDVAWGQAAGLLPSPDDAAVAQHNHTPYAKSGARFNSMNNPYSPLSDQPQVSRWVPFAKASAYPREPDECERVSDEWLNRHFGDYSTPWLAGLDEEAGEDSSGRYRAFRQKRKVWYKRSQDRILKDPFVPLAFRLMVFCFSTVALALGGSIHHVTNKNNLSQGPSAEMAIIVDVIAMVYTVYITVDEYISKPLGLRSVRAKLRLIFLDLFFIVFEAANLALAFESLSDPGQACVAGAPDFPGSAVNHGICRRQKALASVLFVALLAWLFTFSVSVLRLVERVVQR